LFPCRAEASDVAGKSGKDFDPSKFFDKLDEDILRRAKQQYDEFMVCVGISANVIVFSCLFFSGGVQE
jgi:hypothetical protein